MKLIIIAGMPATGKSTVAKKISEELQIPIIEKDEIKEEMFDTLGYANLTEKRNLDIAANAILLRCTASLLKGGQSLIIVNNFDSDMSDNVQKMVDEAGCSCVTIFLNGSPDILYQRYVERDKRHLRHQGHTFIDRYPPHPEDDVNLSMTREYFRDRFEKKGMADFSIKGERIDVDATYPEKINVNELIERIRKISE